MSLLQLRCDIYSAFNENKLILRHSLILVMSMIGSTSGF